VVLRRDAVLQLAAPRAGGGARSCQQDRAHAGGQAGRAACRGPAARGVTPGAAHSVHDLERCSLWSGLAAARAAQKNGADVRRQAGKLGLVQGPG